MCAFSVHSMTVLNTIGIGQRSTKLAMDIHFGRSIERARIVSTTKGILPTHANCANINKSFEMLKIRKTDTFFFLFFLHLCNTNARPEFESGIDTRSLGWQKSMGSYSRFPRLDPGAQISESSCLTPPITMGLVAW